MDKKSSDGRSEGDDDWSMEGGENLIAESGGLSHRRRRTSRATSRGSGLARNSGHSKIVPVPLHA